MSYLFDNLDAILGILSRAPFGLITDVDGTISEIAPSPAEAKVHPECKAQLSRLVQRLSLVAAISGRPALEAKGMVGIDGMVYIGNHGLERRRGGVTEYVEGVEEYRAKLATARDELTDLLSIEGLHIEDKGVSLSIHYRSCPDRQQARESILNQIAASDTAKGFNIVEGKMVVELRPPVEVDKGSAVKDLIRDYRLRGGLYLGDDASDIDAFRVMHGEGFASVCVLGAETRDEVAWEADYTVNGVSDVACFLKWIVESVGHKRN
jgi:trehalose 6-phosphate phosphatase